MSIKLSDEFREDHLGTSGCYAVSDIDWPINLSNVIYSRTPLDSNLQMYCKVARKSIHKKDTDFSVTNGS